MNNTRSMIGCVAAALCVLVAIAGAPGCAHDKGVGSEGGDEDGARALTGEWRLVTLDGDSVTTLLPAGARQPSLSIGADGSLGGFTAVNNLSGLINQEALAHGEFRTTPLATTRMAGPPAMMDVERRFLQALQRVERFEVNGDSLALLGADARLLGFTRERANTAR